MKRAIRDWYLQLRPFEIRNEGRIYAQLGTRVYKKWVPTSGEVITRLQGINRLKIVETGSRREALENYGKQTRIWEWRHLISAFFLFLWAIGGAYHLELSTFIPQLQSTYL